MFAFFTIDCLVFIFACLTIEIEIKNECFVFVNFVSLVFFLFLFLIIKQAVGNMYLEIKKQSCRWSKYNILKLRITWFQ